MFGEDASFRASVAKGHRREGWRAGLRRADGTERPVSLTVGALDPEESCAGLRGRYVVMIRVEEAPGSLPSCCPVRV